jgi:hypothetical protein
MEQNTNYIPPVQPASPVGKPRKTIPPFVGIVIIVVVAVLLFGGVFAWQYFSTKDKIGSLNCVPENEQYGAPRTEADLCCAGLVEQPSEESTSGTWGTCVKPQNSTLGWKTYTNTQYGFEVKYPNNLAEGEVRVMQDSVFNVMWDGPEAGYENASGMRFSIYQNNGKTPNEWITPTYSFVKNVTVNGINGIIAQAVMVMNNGFNAFVFQKGNYIYLIQISSDLSGASDNPIDLIEKIISTFKFTTPDQTAIIKNNLVGTKISYIGEDIKEYFFEIKEENILTIETVQCGYIDYKLVEKNCYRVSIGVPRKPQTPPMWYIYFDKDNLEQLKKEQLFKT